MQEKVDQLINLTNTLVKRLQETDQTQLSQSLTQGCSLLRSHDLIGLKLIIKSLGKADLNKNLDSLIDEVLQFAILTKEEFDKDIVPLTNPEVLFLDLGYNRFFDIRSEIYGNTFWKQDSKYRLSRISQAFSVYGELLNHEPFKGVLKWLSNHRPPMESEISGPFFKFIRNILAHFPFFDSWDEIWISKELVNWRQPNQSIDRFLENFCGKPEVKYRFKETSKAGFTYVTINLPSSYNDQKIYLKDIIKEEEGIKFTLAMMTRVLNTQIESIDEKS